MGTLVITEEIVVAELETEGCSREVRQMGQYGQEGGSRGGHVVI